MADTIQIERPRSGAKHARADTHPDLDDTIVNARSSATFAVENMNCGGCMRKIERELGVAHGIGYVRANLAKKRVHVAYDHSRLQPDEIENALGHIGFKAHQIDEEDQTAATGSHDLLRRVGVAGFAAANIMLLSVAVWAGLASDMDPVSMTLFHWISALIALPAIAYAGQPFFRSARQALMARHLNMDVPISLAIILATAMSLFQTMKGSEQVYFDASVTLLFFLLIGRYLDQLMRTKARSAAQNLMELKSDSATIIDAAGHVKRIKSSDLAVGMMLQISRGENISADAIVLEGESQIDEALLTGEARPRPVTAGDRIFAGTINLDAPLRASVTAVEGDTTLAEISHLMAVAEQSRGRYVRLADRAAAIYAPGIHLIGALTFLAWMAYGAGWEQSLTTAISVLIITCPCALALAVPAVQVAAASRLFSKGLILKSGDGLERLAEIDYVVVDKTGTLTYGVPVLRNAPQISDEVLKKAARMAATSRHPYSQALTRAAEDRFGHVEPELGVHEHTGLGLAHVASEGEWRLGSREWCVAENDDGSKGPFGSREQLWLTGPSIRPVAFHFEEQLRRDVKATLSELANQSLDIELLSGDAKEAVRNIASEAGIGRWTAEIKPDGKIGRLAELETQGHHVLMVGDGLNDAPALSAGHASLAPSSAADISRTVADVIMQGRSFAPVIELLKVSKMSRRLSLQNFALAAGYNAICIPLAVAGYVTPLIAAIAMSASSIAVTANALRLHLK